MVEDQHSSIEQLQELLERQIQEDNPLQFLTGVNLYNALAYQSLQIRRFNTAKSNYWKSILYSKKRIRELVVNSKEGFVGDIATYDLIENSKNSIKSIIRQIVVCHLANIDPYRLSIKDEIPLISKEISKKKIPLKPNIINEQIQRGILSFASQYPSNLVETENFIFVVTSQNFPSLPSDEKIRNSILIYRTLVREIRGKAYKDTAVAQTCQKYRYESAKLYKSLGDIQNYYNELSSSFLYKVYSSKTITQFENNDEKLEDVLREWENIKDTPYREPFYKRAYASIYGLDLLEKNDLKNRIITLKHINYYLKQANSSARILYLLYENFYLLIDRMNKASIINQVKLPEQKQFSKVETIDPEIQLIKTRYRDLIKLTQRLKGLKTSTNPISDPNIQSAYQLYADEYLNENSLLKIIQKITKNFIGDKVIAEDMLNSDRDKNSLEAILRLGETSTIEVKKSFADSGSIGKAVSAFANTKGGKIIVGLDETTNHLEHETKLIICNDFIIEGISVKRQSLDNQKKYLALSLDEAGIPVSELIIDTSLRIEGKIICIIEVPNMSNERTIFYKKDAYKRVDAQNLRMSGQELRDKFKKESEYK